MSTEPRPEAPLAGHDTASGPSAGADVPRGPLAGVLRFSIRQRWLVVLATLALAAVGAYDLSRVPIDAVPDITNVQVQINTVVEALSPVEVEKQVTVPIESAMAGIPDVEQVRSLSRYGLSQVTVVFRDGTNLYFARQLVSERLQQAREALGPGLGDPVMGPIATGLGEVFMWTVEAKPGARRPDGGAWTLTDLREVQDWIVKPQLRGVPGITEINSIGGYRRQYHVTPDPRRLQAYGLTFHDVLLALEANNQSAGGGTLAHRGEQYVVRTSGRIHDPAEIGEIVVATRDGVPLHVHDLAGVGDGQEVRSGAATENGEEVVLGTAFMLVGENSRTVAERVAKRLSEVQRSLPEGVIARPVYSRTKLVDATLETVRANLLEGAALVVAVLFALLGNFPAAIIVALVIPLSMLFAATGMVHGKISANLLSLGAIDFGIIVDGAVVMVENMMRRFAGRQHELGRPLDVHERLHTAFAGAYEVARPTLFGVAIIMAVYLPILTLSGIEGRMFRPMALVVLLALAGSLLFAFTVVPALVALLLRGRVAESEGPLAGPLLRAYRPALDWALARRRIVVLAVLAFVAGTAFVATRLGTEFVPTLDERDMTIQALRIPSTSLAQSVAMDHDLERTLRGFPEVANVFSRLGTDEVASDPMPPNISDMFVILKDRRDWPDPRKPRAKLVEQMESALAEHPGQAYEFTQPIEMRFNELVAGVRGDVAIKVFGDDLDGMRESAERIAAVLRSIRGAADVRVEQVSGLPTLDVDIDRATAARYGLNVADIQGVVRTALAGTEAGEVLVGDRRFPIVVRLPEHVRQDPRALADLPVPVEARPRRLLPTALPAAHEDARTEFVPLGAVAAVRLTEGPNQVSREDGKRRVVVQCNVRGRDLGSFVAEAQERVAREVRLAPGDWLGWGGEFENILSARARLAVAVPLSLLLIFLLLFAALGSPKDALLVFSGVPLAVSGGVLALAARGLPFSITASVGFIALSGVAVLNGLVMLSFVRKLREQGLTVGEALRGGCTARLRPVLMTALVASLGFVPMALATGTGAEVQRPLATVVIGGILSSTLLTLLVLPVLYRLVHRDVEPPAEP
ncbi:MAG: CusA/CzcA family heavy metal efflux RND transporter [Candidatus Eisenbacteria bacterium]|nr:CusA/CzcA family heavy metal efflux RND transporter [Candidatus Eisenbacteria bacterium]